MARNLKTVEIKLPHPGFYGSVYESEIDSQQEHWVEYECKENEEGEPAWPEELRISESDMNDMLMYVCSYSDAYRKLAEYYVDAFSYAAGEALGISAPEMVKSYDWEKKREVTEKRQVESLRLSFAGMESPRYYNFETDRVFAQIPVSVVRKLWSMSKADEHATLTRVAKERHSSYDGFISHYDRNWESWGPVADWDHNQLETLLIAACEIAEFDWQDSELSIYCSVVEDQWAWDDCVNWDDLEARRKEKRIELLRDWLESDEIAAKEWISNDPRADELIMTTPSEFAEFDLSGLNYRCTKTPDLFR